MSPVTQFALRNTVAEVLRSLAERGGPLKTALEVTTIVQYAGYDVRRTAVKRALEHLVTKGEAGALPLLCERNGHVVTRVHYGTQARVDAVRRELKEKEAL